jgi:hypothetical protein
MRHASVGRLANRIYGTVLTIALITAYSSEEELDPLLIATGAVVATGVFALAHVQAELLAYRYTVGHPHTGPEIQERLWHAFPLMQAAVLPALGLLLGGVGLISDDASVYVALGIGVAELAGWGIAIGRREGLGLMGTLGVTAINVALGLAVVVLKLTIH